MNLLQAGFSRIDITPQKGVAMDGYFVPRFCEGALDPLEVNCLALSCAESRALLIAVDNCGIGTDVLNTMRQHVCDLTDLPWEAVFIHATHSHTSGALVSKLESPQDIGPLDLEYQTFVRQEMGKAAQMALADLQPTKMGYRVGQAPNIGFIRRYRMKDGSCQTNPGIGNPDILHPIGQADEQVNILRFDREHDSIVLMNFGDHPDTIGGCMASADWPGFARRTVEQALPGTKAIFFNGAEGDINTLRVFPTSGDMNDLVEDFDGCHRGYGEARYVGRVVAGAVLQVFDKVCYTDVDRLNYAQQKISVPSNMPDAQDLPEAYRIKALHEAERDSEIPFTGMELTTVVAEALRMVELEHGPEHFEMYLSGLALGDVAMVGIPGEPFTQIGVTLKATPGWDMVLPMCCTNGYEGYFPMQDAYDEGGYEARSSPFKAGVAELMIDQARKLMDALRK